MIKTCGTGLMMAACASLVVTAGERTDGPPPDAASTNATSAIHFRETSFDFGKVLFGTMIKHEFAFTNLGTKVASVKEIKTSCGCAAGLATAKEVQPGKLGTISMELRTDALTGAVAKDIKLIFLETNQPPISLVMTGIVRRPIEVAPQGAAFTGSYDASNAVRTVWIINKEDKLLSLYDVRSSHKAIAAELKTNELGMTFELLVRLVPPLGRGNVFGDIKIKTSLSEMPLLTIPVWAVSPAKTK